MRTVLYIDNDLTEDDLFQLQSLISYQQQQREQHLTRCQHASYYPSNNNQHMFIHPVHHKTHKVNFARAIDEESAIKSHNEKQRLEQALITLKLLQNQYKKQRAIEIQRYLESYRQQALIRTVLQQEEENYYRQCIAAAIEQRRVNAAWKNYILIKRQELLPQLLEKQAQLEGQGSSTRHERKQEEEEGDEDEDLGYQEHHSQQLAEFLKRLFQQQEQEAQEEAQEESDVENKVIDRPEEDETAAMEDVWKYLSEQKSSSETPRTAFLSESENEILNNSASASEEVTPKIAQQDPFVITQNGQEEQGSKKDEPDESESESEIETPAVQDHVLTLKDLVSQLAAEPVLVDEQYIAKEKPGQQKSSFWTAQEPHQDKASKQQPETKPTVDIDSKTSFLPQHIFTEAEPTPTKEQMPSTPAAITEEDNTGESHFVDTIAAEQSNQVVPPDPRKEKIYKELKAISDQLNDPNGPLLQHWHNVINNKKELVFSKQGEGTLLLTASTEQNRQFLGSEDELTRVLLSLDAIESLGDDEIRQERKSLVKKCEGMLDKLEQIKKKQWEKQLVSAQ